jgi:hypothetical protein
MGTWQRAPFIASPTASIVVWAHRLSPTGSTLSPSLRSWIMMRAFSSSWL